MFGGFTGALILSVSPQKDTGSYHDATHQLRVIPLEENNFEAYQQTD